MSHEPPITELLNQWAAHPDIGNTAVFELVYNRLHEIAAAHLAGQSDRQLWQTTAVLNEAFLRFGKTPAGCWPSREHFFFSSSRVMRHVLVDFARKNQCLKRESGRVHIAADESLPGDDGERCEDIVAINQALEALATIDEETAQIVELRYFGGLHFQEIANTLGVSESTVHRRWRLARSWLFDFLRDDR